MTRKNATTRQTEPPPHTWTLDTVITDYERIGRITAPFTPDERAFALSIAEAWMWAMCQQELPGRCSDLSEGHYAWLWGIWKVCEKRGDWTPWKKKGDQHG